MITGSPARHALIGLAVALIVGVGAAWWLLAGARSNASEYGASRSAVVTAVSIADAVQRAGYTGDNVRKAVARLGQGDPAVASVRVVIFEGLDLEASTNPADVGDKVAPRRLAREEKEIYDQGQRLKAAIQTNREDEVGRKDEIEATPAAGGGFVVAVPLDKPGETPDQPRDVVGFVQVVAKPPAVAIPGPPVWPALAAIVVPLLILFGLSLVIGKSRTLMTGAAIVLAAGTLFVYRTEAAKIVRADRTTAERAVAQHVVTQGERAAAVVRELGLDATRPVDPAAWDLDAYRKPHGLVASDGAIDPGRLAGVLERTTANWSRLITGLVVLALAIVVFFGVGWAAALWRMLVTFREGYTYVAPAMLAMIVLVFFPFFYGIALSFTGQTIYNSDKSIPATWVGIQNFTDILTDIHVATKTAEGWVINYQNFYWTLFVTVAWTISNVAIGVTLGLALALALNTKGLRFRPIYRVLLILPWAVPNYITALIFKGMFHQQFGVVNHVIAMFGGSPVSWFEKPFTSFMTCLVTNGWLSFPFMMVISLGALQSIPADLYEAARVDGATRWKQFTSITLPSLKPALVPAIILSVVWTFNMFNIIYLVSGGEPAHSTEILITEAYKLAFEQYRYGYAAAYSTVIFVILLAYGTWQNRVTRATEGI